MTNEKKSKILIIEDEALVARELRSRLSQMGCEVVGVAYGNEAVQLARETRPDLILTDIHLKNGVDGVEVAKQIQSERNMPVVFLTAYSDQETVARAKAAAPFGYIIKPVESRELQIAIDIALYKYSIEKELRETQQLLQTALTCIGNALVFVNQDGYIGDMNKDAEALLDITREEAVGNAWVSVLALIGSSIQNKIEASFFSNEVTKLAPFIINTQSGRAKLIDGIIGPMEKGGVLILRGLTEISDPIEMLDRRLVDRSVPTADEIMQGMDVDRLPSESSMVQLLVAPGNAADVAQIEDISLLLNQLLRSTDLVSVYASSQLSVSMPYTSLTEGEFIAESILKELTAHFKELKIAFSVGLSYSSPGDQQPFELFRRANWALQVAQESGGGRVVVWNEAVDKPPVSTESEKQREYHNLVLLWNVLNVVAKASGFEEVSEKLCNHLLQSFDLEKAAVVASRNDAIVCLSGVVKGQTSFTGMEDLSFSREQLLKTQELLSTEVGYWQMGSVHLLKLTAEKVLFIETEQELSSSDVDFLKTLVTYFAAGLTRFELSSDTPDTEFEGGSLIYSAASMVAIEESIQLVAPTDATVLVVGESGTGKELLARSIHDNSPRKDRPFIIVDCAVVVGSLIESELFGHVKGSFTGADKNFSGRLREANGGTVVLDEIGEMPMEVQAKLLRFVQDREIASVGSSRYETVDTRVIAATNRDLKALVDAGEFREDLFYRLNVFSIEPPPLRDRQEDILLLADHYLDVFRKRYKKKIRGFTADAEQALLQYGWPGNIRELINITNRGAILCKDSQISTIHLGLFPTEEKPVRGRRSSDSESSIESWVRKLVDLCLASGGSLPPLGQWLEEDLIQRSLSLNSEILIRAAQMLGIPESTLRRKVARMKTLFGEGEPSRPSQWETVNNNMNDVVSLSRERGVSVFDLITQTLVKELETRNLNRKDAASLVGVSLPTYRRLVADSPLVT